MLALPDCALGCTVTLVSAPAGWDVVIGDDRGLGEPLVLASSVKIPIGVKATSTPSTAADTAFLSVRPNGMAPSIYGVRLVLSGTNDACTSGAEISCVAQ
jgi:hypothetical protein